MIFPKITSTALRFKYKLMRQNRAVDVVEQLARATKILIYMPTKIEQFGAALKSLERLRQLRPDWQITVLTKLEMVSFIDDKMKVDIIPYSNQDLNFFGLPKQSIKQLVRKSTYDLALDFKLQLDVFSISVFELSGAPLKACFDSKEKSPFYNFGIRVRSAESLANKYNVMIKYITAIANTPGFQPVENAIN